ncbi:MAG TPA: heme o synthase [Gemmatimonadales bacterium]|nr:heme o synthase [Gemmatimonadales bacterium]
MSERLAAYWALTKPGITGLVMLTTGAGVALAARDAMDIALLAYTLIGTGFVVAGTNALNQWWERDADARMHRTRRRPLPAGRLEPGAALVFALGISTAGLVWLGTLVNGLTTLLAALSLVIYVGVYTPLKRRTSLALFVGAVPGALPILGGWTAAGAGLTNAAWVLFAILFLWQLPHFLALGWLYREDYRRGGFAMLSRHDADGRLTGRQASLFSLALLVASLLPASVDLASSAYVMGAIALGTVLLAWSAMLWRAPTAAGARRLFLASIVYLPGLLLLLIATP